MGQDAGIGGFQSVLDILVDEASDADSAVPYKAWTSVWAMKKKGERAGVA
jgi:hypothetical protein